MSGAGKHPVGHLALLASAGSGKTTRLCHRYIRLLADADLKLKPDRICALTFTRKAAGEIFDRVVECLCDAASSKEAAVKLSKAIETPSLDTNGFAVLLRLFLDNLQRAVIGTMDSFVGGVVRAFPFELGIPPEFEVAESGDAAGNAMQQDILARILAAPGTASQELIEAFKKATFGVEEKSFENFMQNVILPLHLSYRFCPDGEKWGNPTLIWPRSKNAVVRVYGEEELADQAKLVEQWIEGQAEQRSMEKRFADKLRTITKALAVHGMSSAWHANLSGSLFGQLMTMRSALREAEDVVLSYYSKEIRPTPDVAGALAVLLDNLVGVEIRRAIEKTRGLHDLLALYDQAYEKESRESGRFTFTDIQYLLAPGDGPGGAMSISRGREENRLFIDYRLDASLDHWLLDEFQDTSDLQWAIFSNLVSELIQGDPEGRERSFFYVGDVKQSVYRWRGGNPRLFLDIIGEYNRTGKEVIRLETMEHTYRCSQPVVDAVNKVFSDLPAASLPEGAVDKWKAVWGEHSTLQKDVKGCVALLQHAPADDQDEARGLLVADLLNEIQPCQRGIGVGILTRTNGACGKLVNVLRRECPGMAFVHEGKAAIVNNELAQVLLSLIRLAAHPGDEFAWQHVLMSPLAAVLDRKNNTRGGIALGLLSEIEARGFRSFMAAWSARLESVCALTDYGRQCLARLEKTAAEFDASGSRGCNRFLEFMENHEVHETAARGAVRIMTIHQAKGLGFDMVILPELQNKARMNMVSADWTDKQILRAGKPFNPGWILKSPNAAVVENDPVLSEVGRKIDEDHCFDQLCNLYVAMTRAKKALYMITSPPPKSSSTFRPASLLKLQLAGDVNPAAVRDVTLNRRSHQLLYETASSDEKWYEASPAPSAKAKPAAAGKSSHPALSTRPSFRKLLERFEPSRIESFERKASDLFDPETRDVLDFGSAIHELFEKIEWLTEDSDIEAIISKWLPSRPFDKKVLDDAIKQFRKCMKSPEVRLALARPPGNAQIWREKRFEIILDGKWVSGVFDRVAIFRDAAGAITGAAIIDYKSNRHLDTDADIRNKAGHYLPQMETYHRALSSILDIPADKISADLLFTVPAKLFRLQPFGK